MNIKMKIWLDDVREPPDATWKWYKDAYSAIGAIATGLVAYISFDHDLGKLYGKDDPDNTGYFVAKQIEMLAYRLTLPKIGWDVHSANPVGRKNIEMAMKSAERFWKEIE